MPDPGKHTVRVKPGRSQRPDPRSLPPVGPMRAGRDAAYAYVTDNPYRLLCVGTVTPLRALRQKASSAAQAAKVGLASQVSLAVEFGDAEMGRCDELCRSLQSSPVLRTTYRQMWLYRMPPGLGSVRSLDDMPLMREGDQSDGCRFYARQSWFLKHWFGFLTTARPPKMLDALREFGVLYLDQDNEAFLRDLLVEEGMDPAAALNAVVDSQNGLALHLLGEACLFARQMLEDGYFSAFAQCIKGIRQCGLDEQVVARVLSEQFIPYGERLMKRAQEAAAEFGKITAESRGVPVAPDDSLHAAQALMELAKAFAGHWPGASQLRSAAQSWMDRMALALCFEARRELQATGDCECALNLLREARKLPLSAARAQEFEKEFQSVLLAVLAEQPAQKTGPEDSSESRRSRSSAEQPAPKTNPGPGIKPPIRFTIYGTGLKLYGRSAAGPGLLGHLTTLYFTVFYLPIFPIARYRVSDGPNGKVNFHGLAPFDNARKWHLGLGMCAIAMFGIGMWTSAATSGAYTGTTNGPYAASTPPPANDAGPPDPAQDSPQDASAPVVEDDQHDQLIAECKQLDEVITDESERLTEEKSDLDSEKSALDLQLTQCQTARAEVEAQRARLDPYDSEAVKRLNEWVDYANQLAMRYRTAQSHYISRVINYNAEVEQLKQNQDQFNAIAQQVNTAPASNNSP